MKHTVVALFDDAAQAQKAAESLRARGFAPSAVRLTQGRDPGETEVPPAAEIEGGPLEGLLHRLSALFGVQEPHVAHYVEAVRRGGHVVQVDAADEAGATAARDALLASGAVNIDDRVEEWEQGGWKTPVGDSPAAAGVVVHRQEVSIGGVRVYGHTAVRAYEEFAGDFRSDFEAHHSGDRTRFDDFDPAYRFGYDLATDATYRDSPWSEVEQDAREEWQHRHPTSAWDEVRHAVRHAWERVTGRR